MRGIRQYNTFPEKSSAAGKGIRHRQRDNLQFSQRKDGCLLSQPSFRVCSCRLPGISQCQAKCRPETTKSVSFHFSCDIGSSCTGFDSEALVKNPFETTQSLNCKSCGRSSRCTYRYKGHISFGKKTGSFSLQVFSVTGADFKSTNNSYVDKTRGK